MSEMVGRVLGGYRIEAELGRGGQAIVYRATQLSLQRLVALKVVSPQFSADEGFLERFKREGISIASLDHPHVIPVYEAGETDGLAYLAMKFVEGPTLDDLIRRERTMNVHRALAILGQVARALDYANGRGLVHRDVKPANVLLGAGDHAYLSDFGLTKALEGAKLTRTGIWMGTLEYIAPEQIRGSEVTAAADRYALAVVAYEMLTGLPPFQREDRTALLYAHLNDTAPPPSTARPELGPAIDAVIATALAKRPEDRHPSSVAFVDALGAAVAATPGAARAGGGATVISPPPLALSTGGRPTDEGQRGTDVRPPPPPAYQPPQAPPPAYQPPQAPPPAYQPPQAPPQAYQSPPPPPPPPPDFNPRQPPSRGGGRGPLRWILAGGGAAVAAIVVVLVIVFAGGGSGSGSTVVVTVPPTPPTAPPTPPTAPPTPPTAPPTPPTAPPTPPTAPPTPPTTPPTPPTPPPTSFPSAAEEELISHVPQQARSSCDRVPDMVRARNAVVSIRCEIDDQGVFYERFSGLSTMQDYYSSAVRRNDLVRDSGNCPGSAVGENTYNQGTETVGRVACYRLSGDPTVIWTHPELRIVSSMFGVRSTVAKLLEVWKDAGPFV